MKFFIIYFKFLILFYNAQFYIIEADINNLNLTETILSGIENKLSNLFSIGQNNLTRIILKSPIYVDHGTRNEISVSNKLNGFGLRLYDNMANSKDNVFFSPYSISIATLMAYFGARNETARQIKKMMGLTGLSDNDILTLTKKQIVDFNYKDPKNGLILQTANQFYYDELFPLYKEYSDLLIKYFSATPTLLDFKDQFSAVSIINNWVEKETNGFIKDLVSIDTSFDPSYMVLINAIYFKGEWANKFNPNKTVKENFYMDDGNVVQVDMMKLVNVGFNFIDYAGGLPMSAYHLKYKGDKILMTILIPEDGVKLADIEDKIKQDVINDIISRNGNLVVNNISLPRFRLEYQTELNKYYQKLGAQFMFDKEKADFSGIRERKPLLVSQIFHKAVIEVNENGSEAAAATIILTRALFFPNFNCNKPFIFIIHDRKNVLFMGKFYDPKRLKNMS